jgi:signal transduction histidine kinase/ActR/RegA family two-component response regulator
MSPAELPILKDLSQFDETDWRMRRLTLNVAIVIGIAAAGYFGVLDTIHHHAMSALASLLTVVVFGMIMVVNSVLRRFETTTIVVFVVLIGAIFLALIATRFSHPSTCLWCFPFPLIAMFLLGPKKGLVSVIIFNLAVVLILFLDAHLQIHKYAHEYSVRLSAVLLVISVMAYYFEAARARSHATMNALNLSLEQRVKERTKALEESQERLRQAEKLESVGRLAGGIAHDFNNQLAGIMAFADLIRITAKDGSEVREYAESILASSRRSADLTGQLLAFARKGNNLTMPVDVHRLVTDLVSLLQRTFDKRISIRCSLHAGSSAILGDPSQLHSALLNIALNARDAMPQGGELSFTTESVELDDAFCKAVPHFEIAPGASLRLCIADTGCGMDKDTLQRIFEPFFTTKEQGKGTGMGLPAVYGTVRSHNGAITVSSEPGKGSAFNLYFPVLKTGVPSSDPKKETVAAEKCHGHILFVDDEKTVSASSSSLLRMLGYTVDAFTSGADAAAYYGTNWQAVDLVILDMIMPELSGKDTFLAMKQTNPDIVALLVSGYSLNGEAQAILDLGVRAFIQKPFTFAELLQKIEDVRRKS